jgi:pectin methylesterase-like acyl-CoA thioesterase
METHDGAAATAPQPGGSPGTNRIESHSLGFYQRELDDHIAALTATNPGMGAVVIDAAGHVKLFTSQASPGDAGFTLAPGMYSSIQAAIDAAGDGDAVYVAAGTYREQLTIRGKRVDLLGATADDGSPLVTLESPDVAQLDVEPVENAGTLIARCALVRVRSDAHVTVRNLIIDGRHQGWAFRRSSAGMEFKSITTDNADTIVDQVVTRGFDSSEVVRLVDASSHLRATYSTIQAAIDAAVAGDEVVIATGIYTEDLQIDQPLTLSRGHVDRASDRVGVKARVIGQVLIAASALRVTLDGIAIEGNLEMESVAGATASVTLRNSRVEWQHATVHSAPAARLLDGRGRLKGAYATTRAAIDAAVEGDEVVVAAGVCGEDLYVDKRITLRYPTRSGSSVPASAVVASRRDQR